MARHEELKRRRAGGAGSKGRPSVRRLLRVGDGEAVDPKKWDEFILELRRRRALRRVVELRRAFNKDFSPLGAIIAGERRSTGRQLACDR